MRQVWHYSNGEYAGFNAELADCNWSDLLFNNDVNTAVTEMYNTYICSAKKFIPVRTIRVRPKDKPWMTPNIKRLRGHPHITSHLGGREGVL